MHLGLLSLMACLAVLAGAGAVGGYCLLAARRRGRQGGRHRDEWARVSAGLREMDRELDEVWRAEQGRARRW